MRGGGPGGDRVLLFEEESFHERLLADFLRVCGVEVTQCDEPATIIRFAGAMERHSNRVLIMHLGGTFQIGMVLLEKIRLLRTAVVDRIFVLVDGRDPSGLARIKRLGYRNVVDGTATPTGIAESLNRVLVRGDKTRRLVRVAVRLRGEISMRGVKLPVTVSNLCAGGAFVECRHLLPEGTEVSVRLNIEDGKSIGAKGIVSFNVRKSGGDEVVVKRGMGIRFVEIPEAERAVLETYLKEALARAYGEAGG